MSGNTTNFELASVNMSENVTSSLLPSLIMSGNTSAPMLLPLFPCHFLELPDNRVDCSDSNPAECVKCNILGRFFSGGTLTDNGSIGPGRAISIVVWILNLIFGIFGALTNSLIITVIMKRKRRKSFDLFLVALASMDLIGSITSMMASSSTISFIGTSG